MPEPRPLELTPPPQPQETILENVVEEEETKEKDFSWPIKETVQDFFEKLANALKGVEIFVSKEKKEKIEEEKASPFFDDESIARRPGKSWFYWHEEYPNRLASFHPKEDFLKEPFWIYPQKKVLEIKDPYAPQPMLLSYRAEEIATGEDSLHLRELKNAEELFKAGEFNQGLSLLYRTLGHLLDTENKRKLQQNIEDVENYIKDEKNRLSLAMAVGQNTQLNPVESKVEQKIENAQFQISSAQMQAANLQILSTNSADFPQTSSGEGSVRPTAPIIPMPVLQKMEPKEVSSEPSHVSVSEKRESLSTPFLPPIGEKASEVFTTNEVEPKLPQEGALEKENQIQSEPKTPILPPPPIQAIREDSDQPLATKQSNTPNENVLSPPVIPPIASAGEPYGEEYSREKEDTAKKDDKQVQEIRGVLELKAPEEEDTPFLTLTYDFQKIPHEFILSRDHQIFEYAYYKYKPMLLKAQKYIKRKQITKALNYYRVIREQQIPPEFRRMIDQNIKDITEYLQKYLMARQ